MACPYFYPLHRRPGPLGAAAPLPLGDVWEGLCRADPGFPCEPPSGAPASPCQLGYARGRCPRFPADDPGADAVRFTISRHDAAALQLSYVLERDHHPFAHGPVQYSLALGRLLDPLPCETVARQAEAYVQSYLSRRSEAGAA